VVADVRVGVNHACRNHDGLRGAKAGRIAEDILVVQPHKALTERVLEGRGHDRPRIERAKADSRVLFPKPGPQARAYEVLNDEPLKRRDGLLFQPDRKNVAESPHLAPCERRRWQ
jgi:hypothetical protein